MTTTTIKDIIIEGMKYRCVNNWFGIIPEPLDNDLPIHYLEIGAYYGANIISFAKSYYSKNSLSQLHCIDPWIDYDQYEEYKGQQESIFEAFQRNLSIHELTEKVQVHRGFSRDLIPTFEDDFFTIIYIDGNHEPEFIVEDAVLAFRKLKPLGYLIFDDYGWKEASRGIDAFLHAYSKRYRMIHQNHNTQVFIQKL